MRWQYCGGVLATITPRANEQSTGLGEVNTDWPDNPAECVDGRAIDRGQALKAAGSGRPIASRPSAAPSALMTLREIGCGPPAKPPIPMPVASAPDFVRAVPGRRGKVTPIIDLAARLGFPPPEPTTRHAILVVPIGGQTIGLSVEGLSETLTVDADHWPADDRRAKEVAQA